MSKLLHPVWHKILNGLGNSQMGSVSHKTIVNIVSKKYSSMAMLPEESKAFLKSKAVFSFPENSLGKPEGLDNIIRLSSKLSGIFRYSIKFYEFPA